jgi:hypothetical protein
VIIKPESFFTVNAGAGLLSIRKKSGLPAVHVPLILDRLNTSQIPSLGSAPEVVKKGMYKSDAAKTGGGA